jgi:hypothetical protein
MNIPAPTMIRDSRKLRNLQIFSVEWGQSSYITFKIDRGFREGSVYTESFFW